MQAERVYSVLIVSANGKFAETFRARLDSVLFQHISVVSNEAAAKRVVLDKTFDFVIVNAPLTDALGDGLAIDICLKSQAVAALCVNASIYDEVFEKVYSSGVFVLKKPLTAETIDQAVDWLCTMRERLRKNQEKNVSLQEKMEEIRRMNQAKWLLIEREGLSEQAAHERILRTAMERRISKRAAAEEIIRQNAEASGDAV